MLRTALTSVSGKSRRWRELVGWGLVASVGICGTLRQRNCSARRCKAASKADSQQRWLFAPENRDYFRGPVHVARVREWRARKVAYWRKSSEPGIEHYPAEEADGRTL
jgi:hypothetical protein